MVPIPIYIFAALLKLFHIRARISPENLSNYTAYCHVSLDGAARSYLKYQLAIFIYLYLFSFFLSKNVPHFYYNYKFSLVDSLACNEYNQLTIAASSSLSSYSRAAREIIDSTELLSI